MFKKTLFACLVLLISGQTFAAMLGSDQDGNLVLIDLATGDGTLIGREDGFPLSTEIEYDNGNGILYSDETNGDVFLHTIDPATGLSTGSVEHDCCALNGMEFVGGRLYVTNNTGGNWQFSAIDPVSGAIAPIGPVFEDETVSGLAYDIANQIMYGVFSGGPSQSQATLITLDLASGLATPIAGLVDAATGTELSSVGSIEFGGDGALYGGMGLSGNLNPGQLFRLALDGRATFLGGDTGLEGITGLTYMADPAVVPVPAALWLFGSALLGLIGYRRRAKAA